MKRSSGPRKTANLSESVHRQLNAYALAATAGEWVCWPWPSRPKPSHLHQDLPRYRYQRAYPLDLNHDGTVDFVIQDSSASRHNFYFKDAIRRRFEESHWADALEKQTQTDSALHSMEVLCSQSDHQTSWDHRHGCGSASWLNVKERYLG